MALCQDDNRRNALRISNIMNNHQNNVLANRFNLIRSNMTSEVITPNSIIKLMGKFMNFIKFESVEYKNEGYKKLRLWACANFCRSVNNTLINVHVDEEILHHVETEYTFILDTFVMLYLFAERSDKISLIISLVENFLLMDTDLKTKCKSRCDLSIYILNNNTHFMPDGSTLGKQTHSINDSIGFLNSNGLE